LKINWLLSSALSLILVSGCSASAVPTKIATSSAEPTTSSKPPAAPSAATATKPNGIPEKVTVGEFTQEKVLTAQPTPPSTYKKFLGSGKAGPIIPGLKQGLVPQGITYVSAQNWLLLSSYRDGGAPSVLSVIDMESNKLLKTLVFYENETTPYKGHAGGIAVSSKHLWVGSENLVRGIGLDEIVKAQDGGKIVFQDQFKPETKASFISYSDSILWAGDFYDTPNPTSDRHHMTSTDKKAYKAWVTGYKLDAASDTLGKSQPIEPGSNRYVPDYVFAITDKVQGFSTQKGKVLLSQSAGRGNDSYLYIHRDVRTESPHTMVTIAGHEVPVWFLDGSNQTDRLFMPPMSEGLENVKDQLAVLFESGADKYRPNGTFPMDQVYLLSLN
jgi:hypothetical protein